MPKTLITLRASEETIRKIEELVKWWGAGTTKSEVISMAIDRLHREEEPKRVKQETNSQPEETVTGAGTDQSG
jgi:Arc/MetJ-type ribon-helix-helix transcriptional regulator